MPSREVLGMRDTGSGLPQAASRCRRERRRGEPRASDVDATPAAWLTHTGAFQVVPSQLHRQVTSLGPIHGLLWQ